MGRLHRDEWLDAAKRLAVGRKDRIYHKRDGSRRPNLVIGHEGDKWWAYCQVCKQGDVVPKSHVRLTARAPAESTLLDAPTDIIMSNMLPQHLSEELEGFLLTKGVTSGMLDAWGYSPRRKRLIVYPDSWGGHACLGRDVTGDSHVKWIVYNLKGKPWVVERLNQQTKLRDTLVLTEDVFSMYKVRWTLARSLEGALPVNGLYIGTTLGTGLTSDMLAALLREPFHRVVVFYDGDGAGERGAKTVAHRIRAALPDADVRWLTAPRNMDPKDMHFDDIRKLLLYRGGLIE